MSKGKEELKSIKEKMKNIKETNHNLYKLEEKLRKEKERIKIQIIKEENVLNETEWAIVKYYNRIYLNANKSARNMPKLYELWQDEWDHWHVDLEKNICLVIYDGNVSITFDEECKGKDIKFFIKKYNLKIDTKKVDKLIKEYKNAIEQLKQFNKEYIKDGE